MADLGEYLLVFLLGLALGAVLGMGLSSVVHRTLARIVGVFGTRRERELRRVGRDLRTRSRQFESRVRVKDDLIRHALRSVRRENRERASRITAAQADRALDVLLRWLGRPPRPVPEATMRRCREACPDTTRALERALKA